MINKSNNFVDGIKNIADTKDFEDMESLSDNVNSFTYFAATCLFFHS